jgi:2-amino-4-hydroxy-6-hydroxymethyldihydropteridine diphosphokinase
MANIILLGLGSNLGDRKLNIERAIEAIRSIAEVTKVSPIYESPAWGYNSDNSYYNSCLEVYTELNSSLFLAGIQSLENEMGRIRSEKGYADRSIDIDILFYNDELIEMSDLAVPHPRLHERLFVLLPLNDLIPKFVHPIIGKTIEELLDLCADSSETKIVE